MKLPAAALCLAVCLPASVHGETGAPAVVEQGNSALPTKVEKPEFSVLDKNRDGAVSREEAAAAPDIAQHFEASDRDRDGRLSRSEFDAALQRDSTGNVGAARGGSGA